MKKKTEQWSVEDLAKTFPAINFPEYQREPNVWERAAKQRLVDSMLREFDIASIYLYVDDDGSIDCIDGRQRINAIMSFLSLNRGDEDDNGFAFKVLNEIFVDEAHPFQELDGKSFKELEERAAAGEGLAAELVSAFYKYPMTIVKLSGSREPDEFNLQFTRLNLGTIINSGEKLNAMVGDLRDVCFADNGLGHHPFFKRTGIPTRRFAREQTAAQVVTQVFSIEENNDYTRTRHFDLQSVFKMKARLGKKEWAVIEQLRSVLDLLEAAFKELGVLRNRAITVSTVLLAWEERANGKAKARELAQFVDGFVCRLQWQVRKGLDVDDEYRYLIDFQRHLTQASVEKPAVTARAVVLRTELERWRGAKEFQGDGEFRERSGKNPADACKGA